MTPAPSSGAGAGDLSFGRADQPAAARLRSAMILIGAVYLFLTLCDYREGIANLALRFLLKDHLHLTATELAGFFAITKLAWYCKPFAGLLADNVRLFGTRRNGYLVVFSAVAGALWLQQSVHAGIGDRCDGRRGLHGRPPAACRSAAENRRMRPVKPITSPAIALPRGDGGRRHAAAQPRIAACAR